MPSIRRTTLVFLATGLAPALLSGPLTVHPVTASQNKNLVEAGCGGGSATSPASAPNVGAERPTPSNSKEHESKVRQGKDAKAKADAEGKPAPSHAQLLTSADPKLAAHKQLVYDFWRVVVEAGHGELAEQYLAESYLQHGPSAPSDRAGFVTALAQSTPAKAIEPRVKAALISIVAEGDWVTLGFAAEGANPKDPSKTFKTTWFDMFRVENGRIVEHWDASPIDTLGHFHRISR